MTEEGIKLEIPAGQRFYKGDMVYARYHEDGKWYLAQILSSDGARGGRVVFVEYGNEQTCSGEELQRVADAPEQPQRRAAAENVAAAPPPAPKAKPVEPLADFVLGDLQMDSLLAAVESIGGGDAAPVLKPAKELPQPESSSEEEVKEPPRAVASAPVVVKQPVAAKQAPAKPPVKAPAKVQPEASDSGEEDSA